LKKILAGKQMRYVAEIKIKEGCNDRLPGSPACLKEISEFGRLVDQKKSLQRKYSCTVEKAVKTLSFQA